MKIIYAVTSGQYSDYGIDALFDSEEKAQAFISAFSKDGYNEKRIEEFTLNPFEQEMKKGYKAYWVRLKRNGDLDIVEHEDSVYGFHNGTTASVAKSINMINVHCFAKDEKHAIKIANEKRAEAIANNLF